MDFYLSASISPVSCVLLLALQIEKKKKKERNIEVDNKKTSEGSKWS